eukprot:GFYU01012327.1.p1 GENE.GFYU01012327.1~~GFYU01012327.1.p1  ORF type:complete len:331 (-),score=60.62 GFYU01012327.1:105-1097(-)
MASQVEFELANPPSDGVSATVFGPEASPSLLLVSSWDSSVTLYDTYSNTSRAKYNHKAGVLDVCFGDGTSCFSGGVDKTVKSYDFNKSSDSILGTHDNAVKAVRFSHSRKCLVTGSWDKTLKVWDARAPTPCISTHTLPNKVFSADVRNDRVVVGTCGRGVEIFDLRNMATPEQSRESSLRYQTRCIAIYPDEQGYALSSIEGRVAMEYFDLGKEMQARKYAFKCHRAKVNDVDTVYPVNVVAFHPLYGTFATGGCDGTVNIWDGQHRKRLAIFKGYPTSISAACFNHDGTQLAIASSYTFEEGEKDHPADSIFVRYVQDAEVTPRPKQK